MCLKFLSQHILNRSAELFLVFFGFQCPMQEMKPQKDVLDLLPKLKSMALADRAVFEKGMKAFVSYIQAYAKHECNLIFRIKGNSQQDWYILLQKTVFDLAKKPQHSNVIQELQLPLPVLKVTFCNVRF